MIYIVAFIIILLDQLTKLMVITKMEHYETIPIIQDIFHITYVQNTGAAFGILQNGNLVFILLSSLIVAAILYYTYHARIKERCMLIVFGMIIGGAVGNLIDRFVHKAVIDFLDVRWFNFPIFNFADCFVVIGCSLFAILLLFFDCFNEKWKNEDRYE